jgi:hypothetical protein
MRNASMLYDTWRKGRWCLTLNGRVLTSIKCDNGGRRRGLEEDVLLYEWLDQCVTCSDEACDARRPLVLNDIQGLPPRASVQGLHKYWHAYRFEMPRMYVMEYPILGRHKVM